MNRFVNLGDWTNLNDYQTKDYPTMIAKKLFEVALPLEANLASTAFQKSA
jgi:hypothetical protein